MTTEEAMPFAKIIRELIARTSSETISPSASIALAISFNMEATDPLTTMECAKIGLVVADLQYEEMLLTIKQLKEKVKE